LDAPSSKITYCRLALQAAGPPRNREGSNGQTHAENPGETPAWWRPISPRLSGRKRARREACLGDHGSCGRVQQPATNAGPGMWRQSASHDQVARMHASVHSKPSSTWPRRQHKGVLPAGKGSLRGPPASKRVDFQVVFPRDTPTKKAIFGARDLFARSKPALMHWPNPARAGLALMRSCTSCSTEKVPFVEEAQRAACHSEYLHSQSTAKTGMAGCLFDTYARFNEGRAPVRTGKPFSRLGRARL